MFSHVNICSLRVVFQLTEANGPKPTSSFPTKKVSGTLSDRDLSFTRHLATFCLFELLIDVIVRLTLRSNTRSCFSNPMTDLIRKGFARSLFWPLMMNIFVFSRLWICV